MAKELFLYVKIEHRFSSPYYLASSQSFYKACLFEVMYMATYLKYQGG